MKHVIELVSIRVKVCNAFKEINNFTHIYIYIRKLRFIYIVRTMFHRFLLRQHRINPLFQPTERKQNSILCRHSFVAVTSWNIRD